MADFNAVDPDIITTDDVPVPATYWRVPVEKVSLGTVLVIGDAKGESAFWIIRFLAKRVGETFDIVTTQVSASTKTPNAELWNVSLSTNEKGEIAVNVQGGKNQTVAWHSNLTEGVSI